MDTTLQLVNMRKLSIVRNYTVVSALLTPTSQHVCRVYHRAALDKLALFKLLFPGLLSILSRIGTWGRYSIPSREPDFSYRGSVAHTADVEPCTRRAVSGRATPRATRLWPPDRGAWHEFIDIRLKVPERPFLCNYRVSTSEFTAS